MNTHLTAKDLKTLWSNLKASAASRGIPFDLKPTDIDDIGIPITCPVLGIPITFNRGEPSDNSISFDRIDSTKGYTRDNLIIVSYRANVLKSNATLDEMRRLVNFYSTLE
jgi:hypothetical protein